MPEFRRPELRVPALSERAVVAADRYGTGATLAWTAALCAAGAALSITARA